LNTKDKASPQEVTNVVRV